MLRKYTGLLFLIVLASLLNFNKSFGQGVGFKNGSEYQKLAAINNRPKIFVTEFTLPGDRKGRLKLTTTFQIDYKSLAFKKVNRSTNKGKFYSPATVDFEVFKSSAKIIKNHHPKKGKKPRKPNIQFHPSRTFKPAPSINVNGLQSVARTTWKDTAYAANFKQTQSSHKTISGGLQVSVKPGYYTYLLQINKNNESKKHRPFTRSIHVSTNDQQKWGNVILVKKVDNDQQAPRLQLMNMGKNVLYGKNFYVLIPLPAHQSNNTYQLKVDRVRRSQKDTSTIKQVFSTQISGNQIHKNIEPELVTHVKKGVSLVLHHKTNGYNYALVEIPNHTFPDALYKLTLTNKGNSNIIAQNYFQSYWRDMPTSLLNLNVAIQMLKYMVPKKTIKRINSGSVQQRKQKFNKFWKSKDPTPNTQYNELEAEYYARIDSAYKKFTTRNQLGFNSARGRVYISYGPPSKIKRTYPTDAPTTIIWTYPSRHFVFKATSGFGDFKLVKNNKN